MNTFWKELFKIQVGDSLNPQLPDDQLKHWRVILNALQSIYIQMG